MELQCRPGRISTRGYYYDTETGLYYLHSRYYDASTCRFVNADNYASTGQGFTGTNGEIREEDKDPMMRALLEAYWIAKEKFTTKKYRKTDSIENK